MVLCYNVVICFGHNFGAPTLLPKMESNILHLFPVFGLADVQLKSRVNACVRHTTIINHHLLLLLNVYSVVGFAVNLPLNTVEAARVDPVFSRWTSVSFVVHDWLAAILFAQHHSLLGNGTTRMSEIRLKVPHFRQRQSYCTRIRTWTLHIRSFGYSSECLFLMPHSYWELINTYKQCLLK